MEIADVKGDGFGGDFTVRLQYGQFRVRDFFKPV
jgi:hypothetical protein